MHLAPGNRQNLQQFRNKSLTREEREICIISVTLHKSAMLIKPKQVISRDPKNQNPEAGPLLSYETFF